MILTTCIWLILAQIMMWAYWVEMDNFTSRRSSLIAFGGCLVPGLPVLIGVVYIIVKALITTIKMKR